MQACFPSQSLGAFPVSICEEGLAALGPSGDLMVVRGHDGHGLLDSTVFIVGRAGRRALLMY